VRKVVISLALALGGAAFAAPCGSATADVYSALSSCTIAAGGTDWTIFDVSWKSTGTYVVPATDVRLDPLPIPGLAFTFVPMVNVPAGQQMVGTLKYTIDPPPPILDGFGARLDPTGFSQLKATIFYAKKDENGDFTQSDGFSFTLTGDSIDEYLLKGSQPFNFGANYVDITLKITVGDGVHAASASGGASFTPTAVPEPAAFGLVGFGFASLLALRKRLSR